MFEELNTLKPFFESPSREFSVREVARELKIAPATSSKKLKDLMKKGFLKERKERKATLYKVDIDSEAYRDSKLFYNIRKIKESGLLESINRFYLKPTVILFGSASNGLDIETSDFDLLIISEKTKEFPEREKFERAINRRIQMFVYKELRELENKHLINSVLNGIVLQGEIRWT